MVPAAHVRPHPQRSYVFGALVGLVPRVGRLSLAGRFMLANLVVQAIGVVIIGTWVGQQIENGVLNRTASVTALYVESIMTPYLQSLATGSLSDADMQALESVVSKPLLQQQVVAFKVWAPDGTVLYSPDPRLVGRLFPIDEGLERALAGDVSADVSTLDEPENQYERERWSRLMQVYAPVREVTSGRIIGSTEFYQLPDGLESEIATARLRSWVIVAVVGLVTYVLLAGLVKRGSDTIQRQEAALYQKVQELSALLAQNARLHARVRQAGARTTALNEQALRRVSADLHDGPAQALALALLRLDNLRGGTDCDTCEPLRTENFEVVRNAVQDALSETRAISAGLRLPQVTTLSVAEVAERAVHEHTRRSGTPVALDFGALPEQARLAVKIALHRTLQEALSNASRHGEGRDVRAEVWATNDRLHLRVSDHGPGFDPAQIEGDGRLGLAGMRERAELLEGRFDITSAPGEGTTVKVAWPLVDRGEDQAEE